MSKLHLAVLTPANHTFSYDGVDSRTSTTSPLNKVTSYIYDKNKRVKEVIRPSRKNILNT